jgi:excisionase family DNA binding protein
MSHDDPARPGHGAADDGSSDGDRLLTAGEVARFLAVPESWVREHSRSGDLPCLRLGRYVRYEKERILAWVDAQSDSGWPRRTPS